MRLLVHIAGEADLLLRSTRELTLDDRAARIADRCRRLTAAMAGSAGAAGARDVLRRKAWEEDDHPSTPGPSPLLGVLDQLGPAPDLDLVIVGTRQHPAHPLDSMPIARVLVDTLQPAAGAAPVRSAAAVAVGDLREESVVEAFTRHLTTAPRYREALVTWGSGATSLVMGGLTALSQAGIPWRLILTGEPATYEIKDPLEPLDTDPVVNVLVRWRMFAALDELASQDPLTVALTPAQHDLIRRAADRHRAGFAARDCASLRAVVADAIVRRDGSAGLAVRQYIVRRYEELLATDRLARPEAADLLRRYERPEGGPPLGAKLRTIAQQRDPEVRASRGLASYQWLSSPEVAALQNIGKGSHTLRPPAPPDARIVGAYLSRYATDGHGWADAGLLEPPVVPADAVLAVWLAGVGSDHAVGTVGAQLSAYGPPAMVRNYIGVDHPRIRAVVFGVAGEERSLALAEADAGRLRAAGHDAWVEQIEGAGADSDTVEQAVARRLSPDVASLLLVPTGKKLIMLPLLDAMRRLGARSGVPLFVRQTAEPTTAGSYDVHLWPALTGGDRPLLIAAQQALQALELDVAWRLLAASAIDQAVTDNARRLADAFASRNPESYARRPRPGPASARDLHAQTIGMVNQRLALVHTALAGRGGSDAIRLLVLAADAMEASIAATQTGGRPGAKYCVWKKRWREVARQHETTQARWAQILLLLGLARDRAPITHGDEPCPETVIADAVAHLTKDLDVSSIDALPADVPSLVRSAVVAASQLGLGQPDRADGLVRGHRELIAQITEVLKRR